MTAIVAHALFTTYTPQHQHPLSPSLKIQILHRGKRTHLISEEPRKLIIIRALRAALLVPASNPLEEEDKRVDGFDGCDGVGVEGVEVVYYEGGDS